MSSHTFQRRIVGPVFIIVTVMILMITVLVIFFEKNRLQKQALDRIYYETDAVKKQLGRLMFSANLQVLKNTLEDVNAADPAMLYYVLMDMNGAILLSDNASLIGRSLFDDARIENISQPVFQRSFIEIANQTPAWVRIYTSRLNKSIWEGERLKAGKNEQIFDAFWDISYTGEKLGTLRIGFSRKKLQRHLVFLIGGMLCTSFFVLVLTLTLIYFVVKKNLCPLNHFVQKISDLHKSQGAGVLRQRLADIKWDEADLNIKEIQGLKQAFSNIRDVFILNWDQLESHRLNLENTVEKRTRELGILNQELTRQIEERKVIETRLINSQKLEAIGTLAGGIAHEFNNLFMAITGYASLIQRHSGPDHPNTANAEKIRKLVDQGAHSVKQLMGFARNGKYQLGPININEVVRTSLEIFKRTRRDLFLDMRLSDEIWMVRADQAQIQQVVMNLLLNASEAMPGSGQVIVETCNVMLEKRMVKANKIVSGRFVQLSVQDQGRGIKKDHIQRVFDPFFTTKPFHKGSGLGLASVYGIVDNHGGFATVESTEGQGAAFNIFLPVMDDIHETDKTGQV